MSKKDKIIIYSSVKEACNGDISSIEKVNEGITMKLLYNFCELIDSDK